MIYRIFIINLLDVVFILYIYCVNLVNPCHPRLKDRLIRALHCPLKSDVKSHLYSFSLFRHSPAPIILPEYKFPSTTLREQCRMDCSDNVPRWLHHAAYIPFRADTFRKSYHTQLANCHTDLYTRR